MEDKKRTMVTVLKKLRFLFVVYTMVLLASGGLYWQ